LKNLEVGQIVNTFGIKGFVKANPWVNDVTRFEKLKKIYIKIRNEHKELEIEEVKYHKNQVLLKFKGIDTIEQAEFLRNAIIEIDRENAIPLEKGEYFIADLLDSEVFTDEGEKLGILDDIYNTGSKDIYVVKNELGKTILLPGINDVIKEVDVENKKIIVHLLKGLV